MVEYFHSKGAKVVFGDLNDESGKEIEQKLGEYDYKKKSGTDAGVPPILTAMLRTGINFSISMNWHSKLMEQLTSSFLMLESTKSRIFLMISIMKRDDYCLLNIPLMRSISRVFSIVIFFKSVPADLVSREIGCSLFQKAAKEGRHHNDLLNSRIHGWTNPWILSRQTRSKLP